MPPAAERIRRWNATSGGNLATTVLMGINIAVFVVGVIASKGSSLSGGNDRFSDRFVLDLPDIFNGEYWRLLTSGFLHFGLIHLAFNMFALFQLGRGLEGGLGRARFVGVYLASLLAGSAGVMVLQKISGPSGYNPTAGASGAIFGLLGCLALGMRARGVSIMRSGLGATLLINLVITFSIPGISIGGHLGGLIGGAICGALMLSPRPIVSKQLAQLAPLFVGVGSIIIAILASR
jgi:membrane associated rhomboid family serine protease